jgi:hypothetical protein
MNEKGKLQSGQTGLCHGNARKSNYKDTSSNKASSLKRGKSLLSGHWAYGHEAGWL